MDTPKPWVFRRPQKSVITPEMRAKFAARVKQLQTVTLTKEKPPWKTKWKEVYAKPPAPTRKWLARRRSKVTYPGPRFDFPDANWVVHDMYLPCPHIHLKTWPIKRDYLTAEEQINLLATPKGYRWYSKSENLVKRIMLKQPVKKHVAVKKPFPGYRQFMFEIWRMLKPEMIIKLKEILEEELGMTPEEAVAFLIEQRENAMRAAKEELLGPAPHIKVEDVDWARSTAGNLADKVTGWTEFASRTPRSQRSRRLEKRLRSGLHSMLRLKDEGEKTPLRKLIYRASYMLSLWLNTKIGPDELLQYCMTRIYGSPSYVDVNNLV